MNRRRFSSAVALCGLLSPQIAAAVAPPSLVGARSRTMRFEGEETETVESLKAKLAEANTNLGKFKDYDQIKSERDAHAAKLADIENANKTEAEKQADALKEATKRAETAEAARKETSLRLEIERAARKLGVVDEDAAFRLLDTGAVTYDKDGKAENVAALLDQLVKDKPYLVSTGGGGTGTSGGNPHNPGRDRRAGTLTLDDVRKMTPDEINANLDAVNAALRAGK